MNFSLNYLLVLSVLSVVEIKLVWPLAGEEPRWMNVIKAEIEEYGDHEAKIKIEIDHKLVDKKPCSAVGDKSGVTPAVSTTSTPQTVTNSTSISTTTTPTQCTATPTAWRTYCQTNADCKCASEFTFVTTCMPHGTSCNGLLPYSYPNDPINNCWGECGCLTPGMSDPSNDAHCCDGSTVTPHTVCPMAQLNGVCDTSKPNQCAVGSLSSGSKSDYGG